MSNSYNSSIAIATAACALASVTTAIMPRATITPAHAEDTAAAQDLLAHLRYRHMKTDVEGHTWYLDISEQDSVTDDTLAVVEHLPHLREFYAIYCPIRGDGLRHFSHLKSIEKIDLFATQIDDDALQYLAELKTLKYLDIRSISIDDHGYLKAGDGQISDDGIRVIANSLPNLELLRISGTVTDVGLRYLPALERLRHIEIASPYVTEAGCKWLREAMPRVEVDF